MILLNWCSVTIVAYLAVGAASARAWDLRASVSDTTARRSFIIDSSYHSAILPPDRPFFLRRLGEDLLLQAASPFTMNGTRAAYVGAGMGMTAGLIAIDEPIDRTMRHLSSDSRVIHTVSPILTNLGGPYGFYTGILYAGYSVLWNDEDAQATSLLLAEALITSGVWTRVGKLAAGRERPSAAYEYSHEPGGRWHGLAGSLRKHSNETIAKYDAFPSGHTATVFAIATVFAKRYSESSYVPILSYSLATAVGVTRMIEHTHWASDVFAGACIGYLCADQIVSRYEAEDAAEAAAGKTKRTLHLSLCMLNDAPALQLAINF